MSISKLDVSRKTMVLGEVNLSRLVSARKRKLAGLKAQARRQSK